MFDYKLIQACAMVIQEGGFEKAAAALHITQSAVSQRVKQLEESVGQILLLRTTPPSPTQTGKKVLKLYHQVKHLEADLTLSLEPEDETAHTSLPIAINADTVDTWFFEAVQPFLDQENVILDLFVDDQDRTHRFLRDGQVLACISTRETALQGCSIKKIGDISYRMVAAPWFADKWFAGGLSLDSIEKAPALCFTRDDKLLDRLFEMLFPRIPNGMPIHYIPSSTMYINMLRQGIAYGVLPDQQSRELMASGDIIDLVPGQKVIVRLYWHYWNLKSRLLQGFTKALLSGFQT